MPAPVNNTLPAIKGDTHLGAVLSVDPGVWSDPGTLSFQWTRNGSNVAGATGRSYALRDVDAGAQIAVVVTATNSSGAASATSAAVTAGSISPQPAAGIAGRAWAANTVYKAGDVITNGGVLYAATADFTSGATFNATNWTALGRSELKYAENINGVTNITSTTYADISGLSITFTAPAVPVELTFYAPQVDNGTAGQGVVIQILQTPSTQVAESFFISTLSLASAPFVLVRRMRTLTPGTSYTFKAQVRVTGGAGEVQPRGSAPIFLAADQL